VHNNAFDYAQIGPAKLAALDTDPNAILKYAAEFHSIHFETHHPVVRVHPETGEKALLLGSFAKSILGVNGAESQALFKIFQDRITWLETRFGGTGNSATSPCGTTAALSITPSRTSATNPVACTGSRWPATSR
jgi:hypothetical protein